MISYLEIVEFSEVEGEFVGAVSEGRWSEGLEGAHVLRHEIAMVAEERRQTEGEHGAHEEQEEHVEPEI